MNRRNFLRNSGLIAAAPYMAAAQQGGRGNRGGEQDGRSKPSACIKFYARLAIVAKRNQELLAKSGIDLASLKQQAKSDQSTGRVNLGREPCCPFDDPKEERRFTERVAARSKEATIPLEGGKTLVSVLQRGERLELCPVDEQGAVLVHGHRRPVLRIGQDGHLQRPGFVARRASVVPTKQHRELLHNGSRTGPPAEAGDEAAPQRIARQCVAERRLAPDTAEIA